MEYRSNGHSGFENADCRFQLQILILKSQNPMTLVFKEASE